MTKLKEQHQFKDVADKGYGAGHIECSCGWVGPLSLSCPDYYHSITAKLDKIYHLLGEVETPLLPRWIDAHSINCTLCGILTDERDGIICASCRTGIEHG